MKYQFISIMLASAAIAACSTKEKDNPIPSVESKDYGGVELTFIAQSGESKTKTAFQADETSIWWTPSEQICVFYGPSSGSCFTSSNETDVAKAEFHGTLNAFTGEIETQNESYPFWAVYPYDASISCDGNSVVVSLDSEQEAVAGTFANKTNISIAKSMGLNLSFYNVCSWFRFTVTNDGVKSVTFKGNNGEDIAGKIRVTMDANDKPMVSEVIDGVKEITLRAPAGETLEVGAMYYITLLPQVFEHGFTVSFFTETKKGKRVIDNSTMYLRSMYNTGQQFDKDIVCRNIDAIEFAHSAVEQKLVEAFDTNCDGELSYSEAAAVTSGDAVKAAFGAIKTYRSFDEFQYFTGITSIPDEMFKDWNLLTSIIIPKSVTSIGNSSFSGCLKLSAITISDSVQSIGYGAFSKCSSLERIVIPNSVVSLGSYPALNDKKTGLFSGCTTLKSIVLSNRLTSIPRFAFSGCTSLSSITIPNSVTTIRTGAFINCSSLKSIVIPNSVTTLESHSDTFSNDLGMFYCCLSLESVVISNSIKTIPKHFLYRCSSLSSIVIPNGVTTLQAGAFSGCSNLTSIILPNSVTTMEGSGDVVESGVFYGCNKLGEVVLSNNLNSIPANAFAGCSSLKTLSVPESVTSIEKRAFQNCTNLLGLSIPESVVSIDSQVFLNCVNLTSIDIPESVTSIGDRVFYGCSNLLSVSIPESVTSIGYGAFSRCSSLKSIIIPDSVQELESINSTKFSDSGLFSYCTSLETVMLSNSTKVIPYFAFFGCLNLLSITIPEEVNSIGYYAFNGCSNITSITVLSGTPPTGSSGMFDNTNNCPIYVPLQSVEAYINTSYWEDYAQRIKAIQE